MNPEDNTESKISANICRRIISDILDSLPEKQRAWFRDGEWIKAEGVIYEKFAESMIVKPEDLPEWFERFAAGQDFGLNSTTNVMIGIANNSIYVLPDFVSYNMTTKTFNTELEERNAHSI